MSRSLVIVALSFVAAGLGARASEERIESRVGEILSGLGAVLIECPAEEHQRRRNFDLVCARYDSGFKTFSASWDERLLSEGWNPEIEWTSKDDASMRRYTLGKASVVVYFPIEGNSLVVTCYTEGSITYPKRVKYVRPRYPPKARGARIEGKVLVEALVSKDGTVSEVKVLRCTRPGFGFEDAAVQAVKNWRYDPGRKHGEIVDLYVTVIVDFTYG